MAFCKSSWQKNSENNKYTPWICPSWSRWLYTDNNHIANRQYCRGASTRCWGKGKKSDAYSIISSLPDVGCYPISGGWAGLGPTAGLGWGPHSLAWCPSVNIFLRPIVCCVLAGTRVLNEIKGSRTLGATDTQPPCLLVLRFPTQASFLRALPPRHLSTLNRMLWPRMGQWNRGLWSFRGNKYWTTSPWVFSQAQSTLIYIPGSQISLGACHWRVQRWAWKNGLPLWTFLLTSTWPLVLIGISNSESPVDCSRQLTSRNVQGKVFSKWTPNTMNFLEATCHR